MTATDWATIVYSYFFVFAAVGGAAWFVVKKAIHHVIEEAQMGREDIRVIKAEVTPNHGSSIHDKINLQIIPMLENLTTRQAEISDKVAKLEGRFEQHVDEGE